MLFVRYFQMTLEASGTLSAGAKTQYLCALVHIETLCQLDTLSIEVGSMTSEHLKLIILVLVTYFPPVNAMSKQKRAMRRGMRKLHSLKAI